MLSSGSGAPRAFCSYRSVDGPAVEEFARRLRQRGIDAWLDVWEVAAGDDIVARIDQGLGAARAVLIFFSRATAGGRWVSAEMSATVAGMIEDGLKVIPVMIEDDAPVPPLLRARARRGIGGFDALETEDGTPCPTGADDLVRCPIWRKISRSACLKLLASSPRRLNLGSHGRSKSFKSWRLATASMRRERVSLSKLSPRAGPERRVPADEGAGAKGV